MKSFMRSVFQITVFLLMARSSFALTLTPVNFGTDENTGVRTIYFPIKGTSTCSGANATVPLTFPNTLTRTDPAANAGGTLKFKVVASQTRKSINLGADALLATDVSIRVELDSTPTTAFSLYAYDSNGNVDGGQYTQASPDATAINYPTDNGEVTFGISLTDSPLARTTGTKFCDSLTGGSCQTGHDPSSTGYLVEPGLTLKIGIVKSGLNIGGNTGTADYQIVRVVAVDCPPNGGSAIPFNFNVTPLDKKVKFVNDTTIPRERAGLKHILVYSSDTNAPTLANSTMVHREDGSGHFEKEIGVDNDVTKCYSLSYVNKAGLLSTGQDWTNAFPTVDPGKHCAMASHAAGFMDRSNCFIATAAYGEFDDARLVALRQFRDRVLNKFSLGQSFVKWYYGWSPRAAYWLLENPVFKTPVRMALFPFVAMVYFFFWIAAHKLWFSTFVVVLLLMLGARKVITHKRAVLTLLGLFAMMAVGVVFFSSSAKAETSNEKSLQPYIDSLKAKKGITSRSWQDRLNAPPLPDAIQNKKAENPYFIDRPKTMADETQPYIEHLRREKGLPKDGTVSDAEMSNLPPTSAPRIQPHIEAIKKGKELEPNYRKKVSHAIGVSMVVDNRFDVRSERFQANPFEKVYRTRDAGKYNMSADGFYEWQPLRDNSWGVLGPVVHAGVVSAKGNAIFTRNGNRVEDIEYRFYAMPVSLGFTYRFTMLRFVVPFVHASVVTTPFLEFRDDGGDTVRGITAGYRGNAGIAISLDWIARKNAWAQYDAHGILHTYLLGQIELTRSFASAVRFDYTGGYAGLMFEF